MNRVNDRMKIADCDMFDTRCSKKPAYTLATTGTTPTSKHYLNKV